MEKHLEFLDYIQNLAPEGETALIVRQKPQLKDGELQFHADGAIKCTWPAALPDARKIKPDQAWYGNTASFIVDRFRDGHISASAANCEYCLVLVLDDIGTKSKVPPLAPTWKMETSPGSFQWGYAFSDDQPTKAEFSAAIKAIADAGYTDPGAINAVRNFRLPGSINLKPGRNNFAAKLAEFHPEREFSLQEICDALGVVPAEADSLTVRPIRMLEGGNDLNECYLDNVRVPVENLVGELHKGWSYGKYLLGHERTGIAGIGSCKQQLARARALADQQGLGEDALLQNKLMQFEVELMALEFTALRLLSALATFNEPMWCPLARFRLLLLRL
jgi:hypothetical protein